MVVPADKVRWPVPGGLPVVEINGVDVRDTRAPAPAAGRQEDAR
jgi:hypothetical protein